MLHRSVTEKGPPSDTDYRYATGKGEIVVSVSKESESPTDTVLRYNVHDTGIGISF
jgi:hypothetical protein